jgi:HEAT repeat protein
MEEFTNLVQQNDWDAVEIAKTVDDSVIGFLQATLSKGDEEQRALSLACLSEIQGYDPIPDMIISLSDSEMDVRVQALLGLEKHAGKNQSSDLITYVQKEEEEVLRERAILLIGKLDEPQIINELIALKNIETDPIVNEKINWALSRLGYNESLEALRFKLDSDLTSDRYEALKEIEYINSISFAKELLPLLNDSTEVEPAGPIHLGRKRGIRDVTVSVVAKITNQRFSFNAKEREKFSEKQIEEIKSFLKTL